MKGEPMNDGHKVKRGDGGTTDGPGKVSQAKHSSPSQLETPGGILGAQKHSRLDGEAVTAKGDFPN